MQESEHWLRVPSVGRDPLAFDVRNVATEPRSSDKDILVALPDWNYVRPEKWVIQRAQKEEWLRNFVHSWSDINIALIFLGRVASSLALELREAASERPNLLQVLPDLLFGQTDKFVVLLKRLSACSDDSLT